MDEERIVALEEAVEDIKAKKKDGWDKLNILLSILTPAAIAIVGFLVTTAAQKSQDNFNQLKFAYDKERDADEQQRQDRLELYQRVRDAHSNLESSAKLASQLADDMQSNNPVKRQLAELHLKQLDVDTLAIVNATVSTAQVQAPKPAIEMRKQLIDQIFKGDRQDQVLALTLIRKEYRGDADLCREILDELPKHPLTPERIHTIAEVLKWFTPDALKANKTQVQEFLNTAYSSGG